LREVGATFPLDEVRIMQYIDGMDVVRGTDTSTLPGGVPAVLAGIRRLTALADGAPDADSIFRALARELLSVVGAEEIHVHHLTGPGEPDDLVDVYMFEGEGRLSYLSPRAERPPGVSWVARTRRSFLAADAEEFAASVPRLTATGEMSCVLLLPVLERAEVEAVVMLVRRVAEIYESSSIELAGALVEQGATALALVRARSEAGTDAVTGAMNHRAMRRRLDEEIGRAMRTGGPLSCLLLDLDDFKLVNDQHGHAAGDAMLREVVQALVGEFRAFDRVARYGGDEFVVILPNAALDSAAAAATRALERLRSLTSPTGGQGVSASFGVAQWQPRMSTDELLAACDAALLRSKRQGKGRVSRASDPVG
jgi:diguanylate cyclase (GGDEF)-like protein